MDYLFCKNCGSKYKSCSTCEAMRGKVFAWRQDFCSIKCFKNFQEKGGLVMRIHTNGKTYTIKQYDFKKGEYVTSNGVKLAQEEIEAFILTQDEFQELKVLEMPKAIDRNKVDKEIEKDGKK